MRCPWAHWIFIRYTIIPRILALTFPLFTVPQIGGSWISPIVLAEFPSSAIEDDEAQSYTMQEAYRLAYEYGYAGALAWDYRGYDGGSFETAKAGSPIWQKLTLKI